MDKEILLSLIGHLTTVLVAAGGWWFAWRLHKATTTEERRKQQYRSFAEQIRARIRLEEAYLDALAEKAGINRETAKRQVRKTVTDRYGSVEWMPPSQIERFIANLPK